MPPTAPKTTRREISSITRAEMLGMRKAGASLRAIGKEYDRHPSCVAYTLEKAAERDHYKSAPRSGTPRKTTKLQDKKLQKEVVASAKKRRVSLGELNANLIESMTGISTTENSDTILEASLSNKTMLTSYHPS
jgi:hypothetical protein